MLTPVLTRQFIRKCSGFIRKDPGPPKKDIIDYSLYFMAPFLAFFYLYCLDREADHLKHLEPIKEMDYTQIIIKPFPWGDGKTPFFGMPYGRKNKHDN